ncbi:hypothetical protein A1OE_1237 [Candidatus Endolissoclinum faulkneri L2]|uniref:Uncharacterized protein n=1 Tax=Candidatus Endolissoclinum faulkneri L2 TaxID=1193729 RepID=K7ZDC7_9PROT|nr:hypothetical protein A1OE_1237 [Candidatus Endolissoclinum faulkneri L2]
MQFRCSIIVFVLSTINPSPYHLSENYSIIIKKHKQCKHNGYKLC